MAEVLEAAKKRQKRKDLMQQRDADVVSPKLLLVLGLESIAIFVFMFLVTDFFIIVTLTVKALKRLRFRSKKYFFFKEKDVSSFFCCEGEGERNR